MQKEYKGRSISFDEKKEHWFFSNNGDEITSTSLSKLKAFIDKTDSKAFERIPVLVEEYTTGDLRGAEITSITPDGNKVFFVRKGQKHAESTWGNDSFFVDSPENRAIASEIAKTLKEESDLADKREKLAKKLKKVNLQKIKKDFLRV